MEKIFKAKHVDNGWWIEFFLHEVHPVLLESINQDTICQYTGINDSEGNRIFEGDRLSDGLGAFNSRVLFKSGAFFIEYKHSAHHFSCKSFSDINLKGYTLTGHNIHDRCE